MISFENKIIAFHKLGQLLRDIGTEKKIKSSSDRLARLIYESQFENHWFTPGNVRQAVLNIGISLNKTNLVKWSRPYESRLNSGRNIRTIGVVNAGNIPAVGFHDFLCVMMSGHRYLGKLSSEDKYLLSAIAEKLIGIEPTFEEQIYFSEDRLEGFDAVIATGSNNTSRYFEYYFGKYPHIIRMNRNGVSVLDGSETEEELLLLGSDIFLFFGMGCRSISKIFVPVEYSFERFFKAMEKYSDAAEFYKYSNNYDYYKSIYLVNGQQHLDNGFMLLKEDTGFASPPSVIFYEKYSNLNDLKNYLSLNAAKIQCVEGKVKGIDGIIPFGKAQQPELWNYADGIDTMDFLLNQG